MLAAGAPWGVIDEAVAAEEAADPPFDVYAENWPVLELFRTVATQWRVVAPPMGGVLYLGIDYAAVALPLRLSGIKRRDHAEVFAGLRIMESAARAVLNERKPATDG